MASNITLYLREEYIKTDAIWLEAEGYDATPKEDFEQLDRDTDEADLMIDVHRDTGDVLLVVIEGFKEDTKLAIQNLREYPLPWTFSLPSMNIKDKPLEDVLLAIWKKYNNVKMEWE